MDPIHELARRHRAEGVRQDHQSHLDRLRQLFPSDDARKQQADDRLQMAADRAKQAIAVDASEDAGAADAGQAGEGDTEPTMSVDEQRQVQAFGRQLADPDAREEPPTRRGFRERMRHALKAYGQSKPK